MASQSPFDPLDRLEPGEGRFVIRENDPSGPAAITAWAADRRLRAIKLYGTEPLGDAKRLLKAELAQCKEADEKALNWKERQGGHEAPAEERATYADAQLSEEQVAQAKRQKHHDDLIRSLREAAYHAKEMIDLDGPAASAELIEAHASINTNADVLQYGKRAEAA